MRQETIYCIFLIFREIRVIILNFTEILDIGKNMIRIDQILVHIIKIGQNHISPENELIQAFRVRIECGIVLLEFKKEFEFVCRAATGKTIEKIVDGKHHRRNYRS